MEVGHHATEHHLDLRWISSGDSEEPTDEEGTEAIAAVLRIFVIHTCSSCHASYLPMILHACLICPSLWVAKIDDFDRFFAQEDSNEAWPT